MDRLWLVDLRATRRKTAILRRVRAECLTTSSEYDNNGARLWSSKLQPLQRYRLDLRDPAYRTRCLGRDSPWGGWNGSREG